VDAVAAVTERIAQIRSQIAGASLLASGRGPGGVLGTPQGTPGSGTAGGSWSPSDGGFEAALQSAVAGAGPAGATGGPAGSAVMPGTGTAAAQYAPAMLGRAAPAWWENPTAVAALTGVAAPSSAGTSGAHAPAAVGSGRALVDAKGVPVELRAHGNGRIPASALSEVGGLDGHRLWTPAARSLEALRAAAARDGVRIGVTDTYRPYDVQVDLVRRKGLYSQGGLAAVPGTSDHGWGIAVDLDLDDRAQAWMRTHGGRYGFVEDVPREPWHWAYRPTH
jgi:D-alanyl-D-alanine dipeptidase